MKVKLTENSFMSKGRRGISTYSPSSGFRERPVKSTARHGRARDVLPDTLVEQGLPRHKAEAEAEAAITTEALDHHE